MATYFPVVVRVLGERGLKFIENLAQMPQDVDIRIIKSNVNLEDFKKLKSFYEMGVNDANKPTIIETSQSLLSRVRTIVNNNPNIKAKDIRTMLQKDGVIAEIGVISSYIWVVKNKRKAA